MQHEKVRMLFERRLESERLEARASNGTRLNPGQRVEAAAE